MRRRGIVLLEILWSVIIMTALAGVLAVAAHSDNSGLAHLSDSRASERVAESVMAAMQLGHPLPTAQSDEKVTVRQLSTPSEAPQMVWVEVRAEVAKRSSTLVGLVPKSVVLAIPPAASPAGGNP